MTKDNMSDSLINILNSILQSAEIKPMSGLEKAMHGPSWLKVDAGKDLLSQLTSDPEYNIFDQHLQSLGNSSTSTEIKELADWLVERAIVVGSSQAIDELNI